MSRPRTGRSAAPDVSEIAWGLLTDQPVEDTFECFVLEYGTVVGEGLAAKWSQHGDAILGAWAVEAPGTRPSCWWRWSAPRCVAGMLGGRAAQHAEGPAPRLRLGGRGTPDFEALNIVPDLHLGLPVRWVSAWQSDHYNGRARDVHGDIIPTKYHEGHFPGVPIDPRDPPRFESQASYLDRHDLLFPGEAERLTAEDFHPEVIGAPGGDDAP